MDVKDVVKKALFKNTDASSSVSAAGGCVDIQIDTDEFLSLTAEEIFDLDDFAFDCSGIFKVRDFLKAYPETMEHEVKKNSLRQILTISSMDLDRLNKQAGYMVETLDKYLTAFNEANAQKKAEYENDIATKLQEIETLKKKLDALANQKLNQTSIVTETKGVVEEIKTYI